MILALTAWFDSGMGSLVAKGILLNLFEQHTTIQNQ